MTATATTRRSQAIAARGGGIAFIKWTLISVALLFCVVFLLLPLLNVFVQALGKGWGYYLAFTGGSRFLRGNPFNAPRRRRSAFRSTCCSAWRRRGR